MKNGSGIVIEISNKKATLLMKDGTFVTVRIPTGKRPHVGREYQASYFSQRKGSLFVLPSISLSIAALVAVIFLSGLFPPGNQPAAAAYVSFDINPSLEVGIDDAMEVVEIETFNDEAKEIITKYHLTVDKHLSLDEFANLLMKAYETEGYMKSNHSMLITTISNKKSNGKTEEALHTAVDSIVKKTVVKYPVTITVSETNNDTRKKAKHLGVSSGKYKAYQQANKNEKLVSKEKINKATIRELETNVFSSNEIQVVPHPRKIKSSQHEIKKDEQPELSKIESKKQDKKKDKKRKEQDQNVLLKNAQKNAEKPLKHVNKNKNKDQKSNPQRNKALNNVQQKEKNKVLKKELKQQDFIKEQKKEDKQKKQRDKKHGKH
ncbi:hypothetical protein KUV80_08805 [Fictibacillus nanhaiensis]|uniref:anti-sigma-I factor RsgI family protein n=1 Tax=Fictibacillus nanhaiensis TaxID=742169 RepID=UPI001C972353|nr:hypothetical protein [Fictibacillus nanhaiensis]MBY6036751.1 hypothetical protein [Fictibacillus nanhaiensis]